MCGGLDYHDDDTEQEATLINRLRRSSLVRAQLNRTEAAAAKRMRSRGWVRFSYPSLAHRLFGLAHVELDEERFQWG